MEWEAEEAQGRFSELIESALTKGPQIVKAEGERTVIVLSADEYAGLRSTPPSFIDHLLAGPDWDDELVEAVNRREKMPSRDVPI